MSTQTDKSADPNYQYVGQELDLFSAARNWKGYYAAALKPYIRGRVLEVGAGIGGTTELLAHGGQQAWICLEPDSQLADRLRAALETHAHLSATVDQVVVGTIDDLQPDDLYDSILYIDVVEHIEDDHAQLHAAAQHLAPGGHLIVLSPAHQWLYSPFDKAIGHFRRYSFNTLRAAGPANCRLEMLRYMDSVGLLASMANRFALKSSQPTASQIAFWDKFLVPWSRWLDPCLGYCVGKSVIGIWSRTA